MPVRSPARSPPKLAQGEEHVHIPSPHDGLSLFLRYLPARERASAQGRVVLYIHGATFPSGLSIAHRFDGRSWRDELVAAGFHVGALDFLGFGFSDRFREMNASASEHPPLGRAEDASWQIEQAVRFIRTRHGDVRVSLIAHSWGGIAAGCFAGRRPELVDRLVLFGPIVRRSGETPPAPLPAWRLVTLEEQWRRFIADVPLREAPVLLARHFQPWGEAWLDSDPATRDRAPAAVKVPNGPAADISEAWNGRLAFDPGLIRAPTAIIRGEWDSLCTDADVAWLRAALTASPERRDVKIRRATHLMHLEENRHALHRETPAFLRGG